MTTYRTTVRVDDGMLHTSRPLLAPEKVADMIDSLVYGVTEVASVGGDVLSVELVIETAAMSEHPIGDSVAGTSSTPLLSALDDDEDVADVPLTPAGQS